MVDCVGINLKTVCCIADGVVYEYWNKKLLHYSICVDGINNECASPQCSCIWVIIIAKCAGTDCNIASGLKVEKWPTRIKQGHIYCSKERTEY